MEEEGKSISVLCDASAYLLFEVIGDSDDQTQPYDAGGGGGSVLLEQLDQSDDAQSCSYGSESDHDHSTAMVHEIDDDDFNYGSDFDDNCSNGDEEEDVVDQCLVKEKMKKSMVNFDDDEREDNSNVMNERESDKLFWEACLAS